MRAGPGFRPGTSYEVFGFMHYDVRKTQNSVRTYVHQMTIKLPHEKDCKAGAPANDRRGGGEPVVIDLAKRAQPSALFS